MSDKQVLEHVIKLYGDEFQKANDLLEQQRLQIKSDAVLVEQMRQLVSLQSRVSLIQFIADNGIQLWADFEHKTGKVVQWTAQCRKPFTQVTRPVLQRALVDLRNKLIAAGAVKGREEVVRDTPA